MLSDNAHIWHFNRASNKLAQVGVVKLPVHLRHTNKREMFELTLTPHCADLSLPDLLHFFPDGFRQSEMFFLDVLHSNCLPVTGS